MKRPSAYAIIIAATLATALAAAATLKVTAIMGNYQAPEIAAKLGAAITVSYVASFAITNAVIAVRRRRNRVPNDDSPHPEPALPTCGAQAQHDVW